VARGDVTTLAGERVDLAAWSQRARAAHEGERRSGSRRTAADLVIEDRAQRSGVDDPAQRSS
jgi:hypothetical protein